MRGMNAVSKTFVTTCDTDVPSFHAPETKQSRSWRRGVDDVHIVYMPPSTPIRADESAISEELLAAIDRHKWAYDRLDDAVRALDYLPRRWKIRRQEAEREERAAGDKEHEALMALCWYPCATIAEFRKKVEYLTSWPIVEGLQEPQFFAILGVEEPKYG